MPDDFRELAPGMSTRQAREHWRTSDRRAQAWFVEAGIKPVPRFIRKIVIPADFADVAPTLAIRQLARRYKVGTKRIKSWLAEGKLQARQITQQEAARMRWGPPKPKPAKKPRRKFHTAPREGGIPERDCRIDADAAHYLRRWTPIYRCDLGGKYDPNGGYWRSGNAVLTAAEIIARAENKGWQYFELAA